VSWELSSDSDDQLGQDSLRVVQGTEPVTDHGGGTWVDRVYGRPAWCADADFDLVACVRQQPSLLHCVKVVRPDEHSALAEPRERAAGGE
jgi:hypothetical protein